MAVTREPLHLSLPSDTEIEMTRTFDAPRWLVWEAFTKPEHVKNWLGPRRLEMPVCEMDVRPGGAWYFVHRGEDGQEHHFRGEFREVVQPERIVRTFEYLGAPGHVSVETATFEEREGRTTLTMRAAFASKEARDAMIASGMEEGAVDSYDRLGELLDRVMSAAATAGREVVIERVFDAPREVVFRAWTVAEQVAKWWGPTGFTTPVCEIDARPGGRVRIDMRGPDGAMYPMAGVVEEIVPPERFVVRGRAHASADDPGFEVLNAATFAAEGDRTRVTLRATVVNATPATAGALAGMEIGWNMSLDKLAALLAG